MAREPPSCPIYDEAGSGMHVHILLFRDVQPFFSDDNGYAHLSETATTSWAAC